MKDAATNRVLAVDGGGTRCRIALVRGDHRVVVETGPANAYSDFDGALRSVTEGLAALAQKAGVPVQDLYGLPAYVGLAGVISDAIAQRLRAALPLTQACYGDDRLAALRGALGLRDGLLAHCGTGSFLGVQLDGAARVFGGWGMLLGDEASAQWIGRKALALTLRRLDGFAPTSGLTEALLARFDGAEAILNFAASATPQAFGALAPQVTERASAGDAGACGLMQAGADYIADGMGHMGWRAGLPICLTGGIGPLYAPYLPPDMQACVTEPQGTPLESAIHLAQQL